MIQDTYRKTSTYCAGLGPGQACVGNTGPGMLRIMGASGTEGENFLRPGDIHTLDRIDHFSLSAWDDPGLTWPTVLLKVEAENQWRSTR